MSKGVESWNNRRRLDDNFVPDFSYADLTNKKLIGINFNRADLHCVNLMRANLMDANLAGAHLARINLTDANLADAYLENANLARANLTDANLSGAFFPNTHLALAKLSNANVRSIYIDGDYIITDLSKATGLNQKQLDSMNGDRDTIIPNHLAYPENWPYTYSSASLNNQKLDGILKKHP